MVLKKPQDLEESQAVEVRIFTMSASRGCEFDSKNKQYD
jgi:hypothetical protein